MEFPEWLIEKWYRGWHTSGSVVALAELAAVQHAALKAVGMCLVRDDDKRIRDIQEAALKSAEDFMEKYG